MPDTENSVFSKFASFQALIPQFDNVSSVTPQYFIDTVKKITTAAHCSDDEKLMIIKSRIRGEALTQVINSPDLSQETKFEDFCTKFTKFFDTQSSLAMRQHQFSNTKMLPNEPIKIYASRVASATQKFFGNIDFQNETIKALFEQTKLAKFLEGLEQHYKQSVMTRDPQTLQEAVNFVEMLQANEAIFSNTTINNVTGKDEVKSLLQLHAQQTHETVAALTQELETLKLNKNMSEDRNGAYRDNTRDSRYNRHYAFRDSNRRPQNRNFTPSQRCQICGRSNHTAVKCFYRMSPQTYRVPNNGFASNREPFSPRSNRRDSFSHSPRRVRFQTPRENSVNNPLN